jgi:hypothetical protein
MSALFLPSGALAVVHGDRNSSSPRARQQVLGHGMSIRRHSTKHRRSISKPSARNYHGFLCWLIIIDGSEIGNEKGFLPRSGSAILETGGHLRGAVPLLRPADRVLQGPRPAGRRKCPHCGKYVVNPSNDLACAPLRGLQAGRRVLGSIGQISSGRRRPGWRTAGGLMWR